MNIDLQDIDKMKQTVEMLKVDEAKKAGKYITIRTLPNDILAVYGLQRLPVKLKKETWLKLITMSDKIKEFIDTQK